MADRIVVGPVVVLPDRNGLIRYYYQGATLPDGLDEDRVASAITAGLVSQEKSAAELTVADLDVAAAGDRFRGQGVTAEGTSLLGEAPASGKPSRASSKDAWVDYAISQGQARSDAEAATKAELVERYG